MRKCIRCGAELRDDVKFCTKCGLKVDDFNTVKIEEVEKKPHKKMTFGEIISKILRYGFGGFFVGMGVMGMLLSEWNIIDIIIGVLMVILGLSLAPCTYEGIFKYFKRKTDRRIIQVALPILAFFNFIVITVVILGIEDFEKIPQKIEPEGVVVQNVATEEPESMPQTQNDFFFITDGQSSKYAKEDIFDGKLYTRYYIPSGTYEVTALRDRSGLFVEAKEIITNSDGYNEPAYTVKRVMLNEYSTDQITVTDNECILLVINSSFEFEKIN